MLTSVACIAMATQREPGHHTPGEGNKRTGGGPEGAGTCSGRELTLGTQEPEVVIKEKRTSRALRSTLRPSPCLPGWGAGVQMLKVGDALLRQTTASMFRERNALPQAASSGEAADYPGSSINLCFVSTTYTVQCPSVSKLLELSKLLGKKTYI